MSTEAYVRRVELALRDLPWRQRRELIAELRQHLAELPPDLDRMTALGTADQYAAELRAAAGLDRRHGPIAWLRARRPRNVILVTLVIVLIGLAIGTVAWIATYQPIAYSFGTQLPLDSKSSSGQAGVTVVFKKGHPFLYGITIANTGPFAIRILGAPTYHVTDFYKARLYMNKPNPSGNQRPLEPFRPFDLQPNQTRWLVWKGHYACTTGADRHLEMTETEIPIRYSFLWRTATAEVPLKEPLAIIFTRGGCPPGGDPPSKQ